MQETNPNQNQLKLIINDLYKFYRFFVARNFKENLHADHIETLSKELMKMYRGDYQRLCVAMPPRTSKSSLITLTYPFWLIAHNPKLNIVIVNNSASLAETFGIKLRELFVQYGDLFNVNLSDKKHANSYLMFDDNNGELHSGSIKLIGAGSNITGLDADYIILDDIYFGFSDITVSLLNKKIEWFKTIIEQRLEPHTRLLILHTRWHSMDLQGYLKENHSNDYNFLSFKALNDDGTCIWPERYTVQDFKDKIEVMGERLFSSIYQQEPLDESGDYFDINRLNFIDAFDPNNPLIDGVVRSFDCAYSDETKGDIRDYTAGVLMYHTINDEYIITDLIHGQFGDNLFKIIKDTARRDTANVPIILETGTAGASSKFLFDVYKKELIGYNVKQSLPLTSKVDRAFGFKEAILDGKVSICLSDEKRGKVMEELKGFPLAKHDDCVDAMSHAFNYLSQSSTDNIRTAHHRKRKRL